MKPLFKYLLPITYFRASRLNRKELIAYNALTEWIPAIAISLYLNAFEPRVLITVGLSYLAFISIYEIGYLTNDQLSESFEKDPRGRGSEMLMSLSTLVTLVMARVIVFSLCTYFLVASAHPIWIAFHGGLIATFLLHNILEREMRIATFFSLGTFRFFAPIILVVSPTILAMLLPIIMLNNSLYRLTVYIDNKKLGGRNSLNSKFAFYLACLPLGIVFSVVFGSMMPVAVTLYFILVWSFYWLVSRVSGADLRG